MVVRKRSFAGLRLGDGDTRLLDKAPQRVGGARVDHAATGHDERPLRGADRGNPARQCCLIRRPPFHVPHAFGQELFRVVVRLGLDVLGQRERHRAGIRGAGEHAHGGERRRDQLLRTRDAVPVARDGCEGVVHARVAARRNLELLQDRIRKTRRENIARQEEHGQAIHRSERRTGEHVGRARPDGAGAGERLQAIFVACVPDGRVHHRLLVARHVIREQFGRLEEGLADPSHVAVPEDPPDPREEWLFDAVALDMLRREEPDERLRHREPRHVATFRASTDSISPIVGMASAQARRDATMAPAAFATSSVRRSGHPESSPWQSAPPNASPAPRPFRTSISTGGTVTSALAVRA